MALPWLHKRIIYTKEALSVRKGFLLTAILAGIMLFMAYGNLILNANSVYFGAKGDGLQSYYTAFYQIQHDSTYWRVSGMNYPYGENSFFTGNQPLLTAFIKLVSNTFYDISPWSLGIFNLMMLSGIILCALCLFLIFHRLKLPWVYAAFVSVGITFLSPQLQRMGAHYSLAYPFAIPFFILLLMRFYEKPDFQRSIALSVLTFIMAASHLYFLGIFGAMSGFFYLVSWWSKDEKFKRLLFSLSHFAIQIILPFIIISLLIYFNDEVTDRTQMPWGFLHYRSAWEGVFLPVGRDLGIFISEHIIPIRHVEWEGQAFVGHFSSLAFLLLLYFFFSFLKKKKFIPLFNITNNYVMNVIFWASIPALLYSFGLPFILKLEFLLNYLGPLKQMRGIARFNWIFYYCLNIIVFYLLYRLVENRKILVKGIALLLPVCVLLYDGWFSVKAHDFYFNNRIPELEKTSEEYEKIIQSLTKQKYQAIIPLPMFAVGSENLWLSTEDTIIKETLSLSLRTGIPTTGSMLARTSISQAFQHFQLVQEPYLIPEIIKNLEDKRPFIILTRPHLINDIQKRFINSGKKIASTDKFELYEFSFEKFETISVIDPDIIISEIEERNIFPVGDFFSTDSVKKFDYISFDDFPSESSYKGEGAYSGKWESNHKLFDEILPWVNEENDIIISFWIKDYNKDLLARTNMEVSFENDEMKNSERKYNQIHNCIKIVEREWALIEWKIQRPILNQNIKFTIWNNDINPQCEVFVDEFLIRPAKTDVYKIEEGYVYKNNRFYPRFVK